jgi:membrane-associated phospholipid phosphatase
MVADPVVRLDHREPPADALAEDHEAAPGHVARRPGDDAAVGSAVPVTADSDLEPVDRFFYALSSAADHGLLWLLLGSLRGARTGDPVIVLRLGGVLAAESVLTNGLIKLAFRRIRPQDHFTHDDALPFGMRRPITSSFPSGHAATAFMAAGLLSKGTRLAPAYYALAALVAYSRVHVRMHHAADVAGGAALGLALGAVARRFVSLSPR